MIVCFPEGWQSYLQANKIGRINLAATGKDLMDDEKPGDVTIDLFAALDMETDAIEERTSELQNSQTLGLLTGFLSVDDWYDWVVNLFTICGGNGCYNHKLCYSFMVFCNWLC